MRVWLVILALALGPAVSNGFARFGYGLILPAMRIDLDWSYATAGWINTANALGYLIGALLTLRLASRMSPGHMFRYGMALTTVCLALSGFTENIFLLITWRILAGIGGAPVFIMGGAMAATTFSTNASRNALAISVYFGGGGLGILLTAVSLPLLLETWGPTAWPYTWWSLAIGSALALPTSWWATKDFLRRPQRDSENGVRLRWDNILPSLTSYFLFGAGYIVYMTFIVAWMRGDGARRLDGNHHLGDARRCSHGLVLPVAALDGGLSKRHAAGPFHPGNRHRRGFTPGLWRLGWADPVGSHLRPVLLHRAERGHHLFPQEHAAGTVGGRGCALHHHFRHWPHDRPHRRRLDRGCDRQPDRRFAAGRRGCWFWAVSLPCSSGHCALPRHRRWRRPGADTEGCNDRL